MSKDKNSKQMSLLEDSHVNHSVLQENKKEQTTTDISGQKCLDSLKKLNQSSLLGRMCKALLTSKTAWYSDRCRTNWKVKVSKSNVSLFQLQASVLGTKGIESGLWLTPSTMDISQRSPEAMQKRIAMREKIGRKSIPPGNLAEQVQTGMPIKDMRDVEKHLRSKKQSFPTPTSFDSNEIKNPRKPHPGGGQKPPLNQIVKMYPTPRASGQEDAETLIKRKGEKAAAQHNLTAHMQMFPTPSASCQMDVVAPPETVKQNSSGWSVERVGTGTKFGAKLNDVVNKVNQPIKHGGKLNPTFVEFLMGFPMDWTKIEQAESKVSETQSSHNVQESSDLPSKKFYRTPTAMDKGDNSFKYAAKILKGKLNRSQSKQPVQKTLSMDVAIEHLKNNQHLVDVYDEKFKMRPHLPPKLDFINYLKKNLDKKSLYAADIVKKTTIDHWLRSDDCFSYPTVQDWNLIKPYLKEIKYDYQMTFEIESDWE